MEQAQKTYLPAAGRDWALPLYDPLVKLLGVGQVRSTLIEQAELQPGHRVLDIGCGTGTLLLLIKKLYPSVEVSGLDPDAKALLRVRRKAERASVSAGLDQGFADELPYADASFDRIFSSFMFHHLPADAKEQALREARRVLAPGGSLHLVDFERPESSGMLARHFAGRHFADNSEHRILSFMRQAGFSRATRLAGGSLLFGLLPFGFYQATARA